jgi:secreted PhoX family phosphatase
MFACPDTVAFDGRGVLWIGTDMSSSAMGKGELQVMGNNQLLACNPVSGEVRRFMVGPVNCELTGAAFTPDGRTLFVNVQHPVRRRASARTRTSRGATATGPDFAPNGRPRSATVVVRKLDGGVIGT